jgi:MOSC domain-containing protein YiiM
MSKMQLLSIQVGMPKSYALADDLPGETRTYLTGIVKERVEGPIYVGETHLVGDGQADLVHHGGVHRAILAYSADHYSLWRSELNMPQLPSGAFGENFTISGMNEFEVAIGDIYDIGEIVVQVAQPRNPCWKLARRWGIPELASLVQKNGRSGWYLRVLQSGYVQAGTAVTLRERPYPRWTITNAQSIWEQRREKPELAKQLSECPALSTDWQDVLAHV